MKVEEILHVKGDSVHTTSPETSLSDAITKLVQCNVGSLVVCDGDDMVGILTERDILRACAAHKRPLGELTVRDHMSSKVITGTPDDDVADVMGLMTSHRMRHLPIMKDGKMIGIVSIGDVVKAHHAKLRVENHYLKTYIQS